jgi:3-hydroxyacyl-[acyl-carrier-protein] dehydratase
MRREILDIMSLLPHRYPLLLLDRILEINDDTLVALKNVTINEPFFEGHFPNNPIMPGVLIIEALAQAGGMFALEKAPELRGKPIYFMGVDKARFRKPVRPGDQLILKVQVLKRKGPVFKMRGEAFVDDQMVTEAELLATIGGDS